MQNHQVVKMIVTMPVI